jgi:ribosomal protein S18 acetylase RimI-like enzyme
MEIRILTERDVAPFRRLREKALEENPESYMTHLGDEKALSPGEFGAITFSWDNPPTHFVVGAFQDGKLVGTCGFRRFIGRNLQHKGELWTVYVSPQGRGQGLGKALLRKTIEKAKTLPGLERINVYVSGEGAKAFYQSFGFKSFGLESKAKKVNGQYLDLEYMTLDVSDRAL